LHAQAERHVFEHGHVREKGIALEDGVNVTVFSRHIGDVLIFKMNLAVIDAF
jgi:hypothetical protein